jgi:thiamine pyrophosphate-dependent acetolactate synthase large subunit-like protein
MLAAGIPPTGVQARNPDLVALAKACGAAAVRAGDDDALRAAIETALTHPAPTVIDVGAAEFRRARNSA